MADIPDVWHYAPRHGNADFANSMTRGYEAGLRSRQIDLEAQRLAQQGGQNEQELNLRRQALDQSSTQHKDSLALQREKFAQDVAQDVQKAKEYDQKLEALFGKDLVRDEAGGIDVAASEAAKQAELRRNALGHSLALQKAFNLPMDVETDPSLFDSEGFKVGMGEAAKLKSVQDVRIQTAAEALANKERLAEKANAARITAAQTAATSRENVAKIRTQGTTEGGKDEIVVLGNIPGVMTKKGNFKPLQGDALDNYLRAQRRANTSSTNQPNVITIKRKPDGTLDINR